jgi:hypothetical protein
MALILAALLGVFISLVGVWFITSPFNAVQAFGIDPSHMADIALAPGLGVRDVALGLIIRTGGAWRWRWGSDDVGK